jgi:hypothetical protein
MFSLRFRDPSAASVATSLPLRERRKFPLAKLNAPKSAYSVSLDRSSGSARYGFLLRERNDASDRTIEPAFRRKADLRYSITTA